MVSSLKDVAQAPICGRDPAQNARVPQSRTEWLLIGATAVLLGGCWNSLIAQQTPTPVPSLSDFGLLKGTGTPACEAYMDRIQRGFGSPLPPDVITPGTMGVPELGPRPRGDIEEPSPLLENVFNFLWERDVNPAMNVPVNGLEDWRGTPEQIAAAKNGFGSRFDDNLGYWGFRLPRLDIDNDGTVDDLFYLDHGGGSVLLALEPDRTTIDVDKTERILKHPSRRATGWGYVRPPWPDESVQRIQPVSDAYVSARYVVLQFNGKFFVSLTFGNHPASSSRRSANDLATSKLFLTEGNRSEELCEYGRLVPQ